MVSQESDQSPLSDIISNATSGVDKKLTANTERQLQIAEQLAETATRELTAYHKEWKSLSPKAQIAIDEVIQPWFTEQLQNKTFEKLSDFLKKVKVQQMSLTPIINFPYPYAMLSTTGYNSTAKSANFMRDAKYILQEEGRDTPDKLEKRINLLMTVKNPWYAFTDL